MRGTGLIAGAPFVDGYNRRPLLKRYEYRSTVQGTPRTHLKEGMAAAHSKKIMPRPIQLCGSKCRIPEREYAR